MSSPAAFGRYAGDPDQGYSQRVVVERGDHAALPVPLHL